MSFITNGGLDIDLLCTTYHYSRSKTRTSHNDPDQLRCNGELEDILKRQKPWMTILKPPCAPFLDMFGLNERLKDSQGQVRTQRNALELLEVAMWVALTQHQMGRKIFL